MGLEGKTKTARPGTYLLSLRLGLDGDSFKLLRILHDIVNSSSLSYVYSRFHSIFFHISSSIYENMRGTV